jgi:hypothetical protein
MPFCWGKGNLNNQVSGMFAIAPKSAWPLSFPVVKKCSALQAGRERRVRAAIRGPTVKRISELCFIFEDGRRLTAKSKRNHRVVFIYPPSIFWRPTTTTHKFPLLLYSNEWSKPGQPNEL